MASRRENKERRSSTDGIIRAFYAIVVVLVGACIGYFVYATTINPNSEYPFKLGLDLAGGSHLVYEADVSGIDPSDVGDLMNTLRDVIERRINIFGVSEPIVQVEQSSFVTDEPVERLVVELPGVTDVTEAITEIGRTPLLEFKLVNREAVAQQEALKELTESLASTTDGTSTIGVTNDTVDELYTETGLTGRYLESAQLEFADKVGKEDSQMSQLLPFVLIVKAEIFLKKLRATT